jgi:hypothetical protein
MLNKIVYVQSKFKPVGKWETVHVPTGEKKKGLLGEREVMKEEKRWIQTGFSDSEIDGEAFAKEVEQAIAQLNKEGYEVQSVLPITSGQYNWRASRELHLSYGYGYGYSFTEGAIIIGRKIE